MDIDVPPYRPPLRWRSGHAQTIYPSLFRTVEGVHYRRERLELDDGDFLDLDWAGERTGRVVTIAHGLEGSTQRAYVRGMARELIRRGWEVCAWNLRGCSGEPNRLLRAYHSGATEDLNAVVAHVLQNRQSVAVLGFSLGGNLTLRWLGEQGKGIDPRVVAGVGISVPIDLASSAQTMEARSRRIYMLRFLRSLHGKASEKAQRFTEAPDPEALRGMTTFREFDAHVTAPIHGFDSAQDYWRRASALPVLPDIRVPMLLVNAQDDPFLGPTCFPTEVAETNPWFHLLAPRYGGHVGFVQPGETYWSEEVAGRFLDVCWASRSAPSSTE